MTNLNVILFDDFTALDAFGAVEVFSRVDGYDIGYFSLNGGKVKNSINLKIDTFKFSDISNHDILLIPGGYGVRKLINDTEFINSLKDLAYKSKIILCVCTGSVLLSKTGLLNAKVATSNKLAWEFALKSSNKVEWLRDIRWVRDDNIYTSSGVSAGIDMALAYVSDYHGKDMANSVARAMEYVQNDMYLSF
ncbi:DJ-1/PfpI family protein [Campylobacter sp. faydin G-24]|uniref:DJ-1/PfpI family protein n=1 Tax=Campylobacter anatolicus TaxID=2829105 RepID=A0ABS5HG53_9BACT|nr:DJ-1/PfpI family protein [Campylobacter anatolicus]MBR8463264.1 DJ-1/PfpI family protein [Campylobacter anatolicus]